MAVATIFAAYDGWIEETGPSGTGGGGAIFRDDTDILLNVTGSDPSYGLAYNRRTFLDFDLSSLAGFTITNVDLFLFTDHSVDDSANNVDIDGMSTLASVQLDAALWPGIVGGSSYNTNVYMSSTGSYNQVTLGGSVASEAMSQGFLSIGIALFDEGPGGGTIGFHYVGWKSNEYGDDPPYLEVTYDAVPRCTYTGVSTTTGSKTVTWS